MTLGFRPKRWLSPRWTSRLFGIAIDEIRNTSGSGNHLWPSIVLNSFLSAIATACNYRYDESRLVAIPEGEGASRSRGSSLRALSRSER